MQLGPAADPPLRHGPRPPRPTNPPKVLLRWTAPSRSYRRLLLWMVPAAGAVALGVATGVGVAAAIHIPRVEALSDFTPALITQLYDRAGSPFASYASQRRIVLRQDQIPDLVRQAVVAVEDKNFYRHGGLDAMGVLRAALSNLRSGRREEGASTLTMQLARELLGLSKEKKWSRKVEESFIAVELEKTYSKEQLLTLYLNVSYLGHGQYGIEAASRYFFGKPAAELSLAEAATLAGIYQRPGKLSPYNAREAVVARRNHVLGRMLEEGYVRREEYDAAVAEPLSVVAHGPRDEVGSYFAEDVRRHLETTYGTAALLEQGLQVDTTLDLAIAGAAEEALRRGLVRLDRRRGWRGPHQHLAGEVEAAVLPSWTAARAVADGWFEAIVLESNRSRALVRAGDAVYTLTPEGMAWTGRRGPDQVLRRGDVGWFRLAETEPPGGERILRLEQEPEVQGAVLVMESATGAVRAMAGGWDFGRSQFNRAAQARRQAGSAFKLFVYGAAIEAGFTPADTLFDGPVYLMGADAKLSYSPTNYYGSYYGIVTLSRALEHSYNVTAVKLLDLVGVDRVIDFARRAGITSELPPYPSLALGSADIAPIELAAAYAAIANRGTWVEPYLVERVRTQEGEVLEERVAKTRMVTTPEVAFVLSRMLEGVVDRGTARALWDLDLDIAGKTGTTNDFSNAWFVGFTPRYTILTWVGYDVVRTLGKGMAGDKVAVPIWREIALDGLEKGWLAKGQRFAPPPAAVREVWMDRLSGLRSTLEAPQPILQAFLPGTEPLRDYSPDWGSILALPWYQQRPFYIPKGSERMPEHFQPEELAATAAAPAGE